MKEQPQTRASQPKYQSIIECAHSNIIKIFVDFLGFNYNIIAPDGTFILANDKMRSQIKDNQKAGEIDSIAWEDCKKVMISGRSKMIEEEYNDVWYLSFKHPLIQNNKCVAVLIVSIDITEKKKAEIAKRKFLSSVSHDIKTPLAGITMLAKSMEAKEIDAHNKELLNLISESSISLTDYLKQIINASGCEDKTENESVIFDVKETIESVIDMVSAHLKAKKLKLYFDCENVPVQGNQLEFKQICLNLLSNAIKFTDKGQIKVTVSFIANGLILAVSDTGIGIAEENKTIIFEKFKRVVPSFLEPELTGAGLGLSIVKSLVEKMKGAITLNSKINEGSVFSVYLPFIRQC